MDQFRHLLFGHQRTRGGRNRPRAGCVWRISRPGLRGVNSNSIFCFETIQGQLTVLELDDAASAPEASTRVVVNDVIGASI
jgi:hypothetical protein